MFRSESRIASLPRVVSHDQRNRKHKQKSNDGDTHGYPPPAEHVACQKKRDAGKNGPGHARDEQQSRSK